MRPAHVRLFMMISVLIAGLVWWVLAPAPVAAQGFNILSVVSPECRACGACSVCDLMSVLTKTMRFLLSLSGALGLALLIWGGWTLMLSGGKAEEVEHGKKIISGTVVGLAVIILLAWVWPTWVILALKGIPEDNKPPTIFGSDQWWLTPCQKFEEPNKGRLCAERPEQREKPMQNECILDLKSSKYKPDGERCGEETGKLGVCYGGKCNLEEACMTIADCEDYYIQGFQANYCRMFPGSSTGIGICKHPMPGDDCASPSECPDFNYNPGGRGITGTVDMYCGERNGQKQCLLNRDSVCEISGINYTTLCPFDAPNCVDDVLLDSYKRCRSTL